MFKEWLLNSLNLGDILPLLVGSGGMLWAIIERKNRKALLKKSQAEALISMQDSYDKFCEDMNVRYTNSLALISELEERCAMLKAKHELLRKEAITLERSLNDVKIKLVEETHKYEILKKDYENLKISHNILKEDYENLKKLTNEP